MKSQSGQSLFELVVAIAISALIIVAMVSLAVNSIQNSNFAKNKALAISPGLEERRRKEISCACYSCIRHPHGRCSRNVRI